MAIAAEQGVYSLKLLETDVLDLLDKVKKFNNGKSYILAKAEDGFVIDCELPQGTHAPTVAIMFATAYSAAAAAQSELRKKDNVNYIRIDSGDDSHVAFKYKKYIFGVTIKTSQLSDLEKALGLKQTA